MSNNESLNQQFLDIAEEANLSVSKHRHVTPGAVLTVVERSFAAHKDSPLEVQEFHAMRELSAFIALMQANKLSATYTNHTDLLPVSHPASTRSHTLTASGLIKARLRWTLADSRISEEASPLLAAAFLAEPNSVEYIYAVTRLNALPKGSFPLEALVAAFGDGNSREALSQRAMLQRRDRKGRFAYQGGGGSALVELANGVVQRLTGRPVSQSADGSTIRMETPDGRLVDVPTDGIEFIKAVINPTADGYSGVAAKYNAGDTVTKEADLKTFDAPHGFEKDSVYTGPGTQYTDDSYNVVKKDDGSFLVSRRGMGEDLGTADSWSDVQKMIQDDDDNLAKAEGREPIARLTPEQIERMYDDNFDPNEIETPGSGGGGGGGEEPPQPPAGGGDFEYQYPEGAYKLSTNVQHTPGTNPLNDSEDYTDDPTELAQMFPGAGGAQLIGAALQKALLPQSGSRNASGFADLPFEFDEPVPAEALYLALQELGVDAKKHAARVYDTKLDGSPNLDAYTASRETPVAEIPAEETPKAETPVAEKLPRDVEPKPEPGPIVDYKDRVRFTSPQGDWKWTPSGWELSEFGKEKVARQKEIDDSLKTPQGVEKSATALPEIGGGWTPTQEKNSGRNLPAYRKNIDGVTYEFSEGNDGNWYLSEVRGEDYYLPRGENRTSPTADAESFENLARLAEDAKQKQQRDAILRILGRDADQELIDIVNSGTADEVREAILNSEFYANLSEDAIKYLRDEDRSFLPDANNLRALDSALEKIKDNYPAVETPETSYPESGGAFNKDQLDSFVEDIQSMLDSRGLSGTVEVLSSNPSAKQYEISSKVRVNIADNDERLTITSYSDGFTVMRTDVEDGNGILLSERPDDTPTVEDVLSEVGKTLDGYKNEGEKVPTPTDEPNSEEIADEISSADLTDDEMQAMLDGEGIAETDEIEGEAPAEVRSSRADDRVIDGRGLVFQAPRPTSPPKDKTKSVESPDGDWRWAPPFGDVTDGMWLPTKQGSEKVPAPGSYSPMDKIVEDALLEKEIPSVDDIVEDNKVETSVVESVDEINEALSSVDLMDDQGGTEEPEIFAPGTPVNGAVILEGGTIIPAESVTAPNGNVYDVSAVLLPRYDGQPEVYDISIRDPKNPGMHINSATAASLAEAQALHADMVEGLTNGTITVNTDINFGRDVADVQQGDSSPYVTSPLLPNSPAERMRVIGDTAFRRWQEENNIYADGVNQARLGDRVVHSYDGWNGRGEGTIVDWTTIQNSGDRTRESYAVVVFQDGSYALWSTRMLFLNGRREGLEGRSDYAPPTEVPTAPALDPERVRQVALTNKYTVERRGRGGRKTKIIPYVSENQGTMVGETKRAMDLWEERKARVDEYRRANGLPVADIRPTELAPPTTGLARIVWLRASGVDTTGMQVEQPTPRNLRRRATTTPAAPIYSDSQLSPEVYETIVERIGGGRNTITAGNTSLIAGDKGITIFDNIGDRRVGMILPDGSFDWFSSTAKARHGRDVLDALRNTDIIPAGSIPPPRPPTSGPTEEERAARRAAEAETARIAEEQRAARTAENQAWLDTNKQVISDMITASNLEGFDPAAIEPELAIIPSFRVRYQPEGFQNKYTINLSKREDGSISATVLHYDPTDPDSAVVREDAGSHQTIEEAVTSSLAELKKATEKNGELTGEELQQYIENEARRRALPRNERAIAERFIDRPIEEVTPTTGGTFDGLIKGVEELEPDRIDPNAVKGQNGEIPTQADFEALGWEPRKAAEIAHAAASRPSIDYIVSLVQSLASNPADRTRIRKEIEEAFSVGMGTGSKIGKYTIGEVTASSLIDENGNGSIDTSIPVLDSNGRRVADARRSFTFKDGKLTNVYNAYLVLPSGTRGSSGFSGLFNQNSENWYIANGAESITVSAAGGGGYNGAYVWAITGFNWRDATTGVTQLSGMLRSRSLKENEKADLERIKQRAFDAFGVDSMDDLRTAARSATEIPAGFPTPREFALVGWTPQAAVKGSKWFGQKYMSNSPWGGKKNLKPTAVERVQNYTYEDMTKSREAARRGENSFKVSTWLGSIFTNPDTYNDSGAVIAPYADELSTLMTGRGDRSVSLLSPPARVALAKYVADMLTNGDYLIEGNTAGVRNKNAANTKSLVDIMGALQTDRLGREPNKTALSTRGQDVKSIPASSFTDVTDPNTPKVLDNGLVVTRLPNEMDVPEGSSGAVGGASPAWKVVDPRTGETFYVKDTTNVGSAQSEVAVNALARSMNLLGTPIVDVLGDNPNFMVTSELGTNMSLSQINPADLAVDSPAGFTPSLDTPYMVRAGESGLFGDAAKNANQMAMENLLGIALLDAIAQNEDRHAGNIMMVRNTRSPEATSPAESWIPVPFDHADSIAVDHANGNTSTGELLSPAEFLRTSMGDSVEWAAALLEQMGPIAFKMMMDRKIQEAMENLKANYGGYMPQAVFDSFMSRLEETSGYTADEWVSVLGSSRG